MFETNLIKVNGEWTTGDIGPKNLAVLVALPLIVAVVAIVLWKKKKEDSSKEQKEEKQRESENSFIDWLGCVIPAFIIAFIPNKYLQSPITSLLGIYCLG